MSRNLVLQELGEDHYVAMVENIIAGHKVASTSIEPDMDRLVPDYSGLDFKSAPKVPFTYTWGGGRYCKS